MHSPVRNRRCEQHEALETAVCTAPFLLSRDHLRDRALERYCRRTGKSRGYETGWREGLAASRRAVGETKQACSRVWLPTGGRNSQSQRNEPNIWDCDDVRVGERGKCGAKAPHYLVFADASPFSRRTRFSPSARSAALNSSTRQGGPVPQPVADVRSRRSWCQYKARRRRRLRAAVLERRSRR